MEDLKQALRDFVATSNSGKYQDEATLLSKFPELSGYDAQVLRDFVATSNSGQYASEEELFSKFPEFGQPVKKKEESSVPLWLQKQEQPKPKPEPTLPFLESKPSGISLGSQRVPETAPMFEAPPMRTPEEAQAIVETPEYKETPYFTGAFGQLLRNMESPWNPAAWVADKIAALRAFPVTGAQGFFRVLRSAVDTSIELSTTPAQRVSVRAAAKRKARAQQCICGASFPKHIAEFMNNDPRASHTCRCGKVYIVTRGKFVEKPVEVSHGA